MEKCKERCPFCSDHADENESYHRVYPHYLGGPYQGKPHCTGCGAHLVDGEWFKECAECGARADQLHGLFVPHLCKECYTKLREQQILAGRVCGKCRLPYIDCCC